MIARTFVYFNDIAQINKFVTELNYNINSDVDIISGRYTINAKSIMGIYSLNLSSPIEVILFSEDKEEIETFNKLMKEFEVKND